MQLGSFLFYVKVDNFFVNVSFFDFFLGGRWVHRFCILVCPVFTCVCLSRIILVITHVRIMNFSVLVFWALCFLYPEFYLPWPETVYCLDFLAE